MGGLVRCNRTGNLAPRSCYHPGPTSRLEVLKTHVWPTKRTRVSLGPLGPIRSWGPRSWVLSFYLEIWQRHSSPSPFLLSSPFSQWTFNQYLILVSIRKPRRDFRSPRSSTLPQCKWTVWVTQNVGESSSSINVYDKVSNIPRNCMLWSKLGVVLIHSLSSINSNKGRMSTYLT